MATSAPKQPTEKLRLKIGGMQCSFCVESIRKAYQRTDGVVEVGVSLSHEETLIEYEPDRVNSTELSDTLRDLGYPVRDQRANLALISNGARVVAVSSVFSGDEDAWGANHAIDGNASTHWATDGDGDDAWIEIELAGEASISEIGFRSRTMGTSAQIFAFRVVTDRGETHGPFKLTDALTTIYFPVDFTAQRLKFEAVETRGSNTGAVAIEAYGASP